MTARRHWSADLALAGITFIWGATFVVVKEALESASTLIFLALRFTLASVVLALLFRRSIRSKKVLWPGIAVGSALFLGYLFQTLGLRLTTPSKSAFITALAVVLVPLYSAALGRVWPSWNALAGCVAAVAGLYLLVAPSGLWEFSKGDVLTLLCAASFGVHILLLGRFSRSVGVGGLSVAQIAVAAGLSLATCSWAEAPYVRWTSALIAAVVVTGLLATAMAFTVQTWAQQYTSPTRAALIFALEPVFACLTSQFVLGESLGGRGIWGATLILAGVLLSEMKPSTAGSHPF